MFKKFSLWLLLPLYLSYFIQSKINNTCKSYSGYFNSALSGDCYYNPDLDDNVQNIIQRHVGKNELHEVETEDGFILGLIRIPRNNPKGVILFNHPITHDCRIWVSQYNTSIAFLFWRAGYDIWLSNNRGTFYSKKHKTFTTKNSAFWNYSFHELGYYDNHAVAQYIKNKTNGSKIINLGYSLGAGQILVYASTRPEKAAETIELAVAIAPVTHLKKTTSNFQYIAPKIFKYYRSFGFNIYKNLAPHESWYMQLSRIMFRISPFKKFGAYLASALVGWNPEEYDPELVNGFMEKISLDVSLKTFYHYLDIFESDKLFKMYDYGEEHNLKLYGSRKPPLYPFGKIAIPVYLMYAEKDTLSHPEDNEILFKNFSEKAQTYGKFEIKGMNHFDVVFGRRRKMVYQHIIKLLEKIKKQ